jgi:hypothetical protein
MEKVEIFTRFLDLARIYCREEQSEEFYAGQLGISRERLSDIIWEKSESNFSDWLDTMQKRV